MQHQVLTMPRSTAVDPLSQGATSRHFVFLSQNEEVSFAANLCIDVLRAAQRLIGGEAYTWSHYVANDTLDYSKLRDRNHTLVLVGGLDDPWHSSKTALPQIRACILNAERICVVGSAIFALLAADVLSVKKLSVHPNFRPGVFETDPMLELSETTTSHVQNVSSTISPAAATLMIVDLVGAHDGEFARAALAKYLGLERSIEDNCIAVNWRNQRMARGDFVITKALEVMQEHMEDTLSIRQIANLLDISPRSLERRFRDQLGQSPLKIYRDLRLDRARSLLSQTTLPIYEVAVACGFSNSTLMKRWFVEKYDTLPTDVRLHAFGDVRAI